MVFEHDFKCKIEDIFSSFEKDSMAAASLAQVHRATIKGTNQEVAVKLQYPTLRSQYTKDMDFIQFLVKTGDKLLNLNGYNDINFSKIIGAFRESLEDELDFRFEMSNGEKSKKHFSDNKDIHIPDYYHDYCSKRVLTMEFIRGAKINDLEAIEGLCLDPKTTAKILSKAMAQMIFRHGHVHCDAHPGNLMIRPNPKKPSVAQLVILDHGFYRKYDNEFLTIYCRLWQSMITRDYATMKELSYKLGINEYYRFLPLMLLWQSRGSRKLGYRMSPEEKKKMGEQFKKQAEKRNKGKTEAEKKRAALNDINKFMQHLPEHLMFIIRASNLVGIHCLVLGGNQRERLMTFTEVVYDQVYKGKPFWRGIMFMWFRFKLYFYENAFVVYSWFNKPKVHVY